MLIGQGSRSLDQPGSRIRRDVVLHQRRIRSGATISRVTSACCSARFEHRRWTPRGNALAKRKTEASSVSGTSARAASLRGAVVEDSEIARYAYDLYLARGRAPGGEVADWLQAERELRRPTSGWRLGVRTIRSSGKACAVDHHQPVTWQRPGAAVGPAR